MQMKECWLLLPGGSSNLRVRKLVPSHAPPCLAPAIRRDLAVYVKRLLEAFSFYSAMETEGTIETLLISLNPSRHGGGLFLNLCLMLYKIGPDKER